MSEGSEIEVLGESLQYIETALLSSRGKRDLVDTENENNPEISSKDKDENRKRNFQISSLFEDTGNSDKKRKKQEQTSRKKAILLSQDIPLLATGFVNKNLSNETDHGNVLEECAKNLQSKSWGFVAENEEELQFGNSNKSIKGHLVPLSIFCQGVKNKTILPVHVSSALQV
eukprot:GHVP01014388.1.p2 GENE.GHVP01014388.1~~GHVP01014388.1.p2  ORF type:complete len:172 (+),score=59.60 GHVP01014388.1:381-896(+)